MRKILVIAGFVGTAAALLLVQGCGDREGAISTPPNTTPDTVVECVQEQLKPGEVCP